jgi:hypothetical protein
MVHRKLHPSVRLVMFPNVRLGLIGTNTPAFQSKASVIKEECFFITLMLVGCAFELFSSVMIWSNEHCCQSRVRQGANPQKGAP